MPGQETGFAIWLTGLPSSGKSTLAQALARHLAREGISVQILDSDDLRETLTPQATYTPSERRWFYEVLVYITGLLTDNGVNVLIAATGPRRSFRRAGRQRLSRFAEVYVDCPLAVCRERDPKGLWQRADAGEIDTLPGAGAPYEPPEDAEVRVDTAQRDVDSSVREILSTLRTQGFFD